MLRKRARYKYKYKKRRAAPRLVMILVLAAAVGLGWLKLSGPPLRAPEGFELSDVPEYSGQTAIEINGGKPYFTSDEIKSEPFEDYSELDSLGRCGPATACLSRELMPTAEREGIGMIKPSGWHTVRYDDLIADKYLYNRCHLIAYALSGQNANEKNLITGTRYFNVEGMLPYEIKVADYIRKTGNHVMYRVTPAFEKSHLVARGVLMEAYSVEDSGKGLELCVFVYNIQPGIEIDYATGESQRAEK